MERTVFFIQHQIKTALEPSPEFEKNWKLHVELEKLLLKRLGDVLQVLHFEKHVNLDKFAGTTVWFGGRSGIDLIGRIGLKPSDSDEQWVEQLHAVDRLQIDKIRDGSADRFDLEKQLSDQIGVEYIYTDYSLGGTEKYRDFISQLHMEAVEKNFVLEQGETMKIRVLEADSEAVRLDASTCTIAIPISMKTSDIWDVLVIKGKELVQEFVKLNQAQEEFRALVLSAKRKFRFVHSPGTPLSQDQHFSTPLHLLYAIQHNSQGLLRANVSKLHMTIVSTS